MEEELLKSAHSCDLCKVNYATNNELDDHNWSLMHHIKLEKLKKGAPHSCNLCMETCSNIIEYGKHLNEDRHKLALNRRGKDAATMLDSFSGSDKPFGDNALEGSNNKAEHEMANVDAYGFSGYGNNNLAYGESEPFRQSSGPYPLNRWEEKQHQMYFHGKKNAQGYRDANQKGHFKVPRGRGHHRAYSDSRQDFRFDRNRGRQEDQRSFHSDDYDINWQDNSFYNSPTNYPYNWTGGKGKNKNKMENRKGSFGGYGDYNRKQKFTEQWIYGKGKGHRGRGRIREHRNHQRSASYDNISPESTSSSDSSLKRRHDNDDFQLPEKSRRRIDPPETFHNSGPPPNSAGSVFEERNAHSRSSSKDRLRDSGYGRSETESDSRSSYRKVTWSDQHVTSTTEKPEKPFCQSSQDSRKAQKGGKHEKNFVLPDSSSESEGKRKNLKDKKKRNVTPHDCTGKLSKSPSPVPSVSIPDQGSSVLERAEKLCKKLRTDREKAKSKKKEDEKAKKIEKEREINEKMESLAIRNKSNIKGVLDTSGSLVSESKTEKAVKDTFVPSESLVTSGSSVMQAQAKTVVSNESPKPSSSQMPKDGDSPNIADRIAQTKADIDAIRAKIETSVQKEMGHKEMSPGIPFVDTPPKYPQATDRNSLMKMVNSPRTTKERLSLAQMLREHARSQTKLTLPRFNLKYSDLCSGSEHMDEFTNFNVDDLAPDVQLQIANLIEADIKPDISELERLLDQASEGNEIDANILSDLGINSPLRQSSLLPSGLQNQTNRSPRREETLTQPLSTNESRPISKCVPEAVRQTSPTKDAPYSFGASKQREKHQSPTPFQFIDNTAPERDMPPPRPHFRSSSYTGATFQPQTDGLSEFAKSPYRSPTPTLPYQGKSSYKPASDTKYSGEREMSPVRSVLNIEDLRSEKQGNRSPVSRASATYPAVSAILSSLAMGSSSEKSVGVNHGQSKSTEDSMPTGLSAIGRVIKQEVVDDDYETALGNTAGAGNVMEIDLASRQPEETSLQPAAQFSPVRRSVHTQNLYREEAPVRDYGGQKIHTEDESRSALEKVSRILDAVPAPELETKTEKQTPPVTTPDEKPLESSLNSQATILDEVYKVSLHEENVRQELGTVDLKINKLQSLIQEATEQLQQCNNQKQQLLEQEKTYRSKRLRLLEESRSSSSCSVPGDSGLPTSMPASLQNNPVFMKFMMSQRQSDLSSVGGFSNVESGSQPDIDNRSQRRNSTSDNISDVAPVSDDNAVLNNATLFSKSLDVLSGSTDTITSSQSVGDKGNTTPVNLQNVSTEFKEVGNRCTGESIDSTNSFSFLNKPLDKVGFVTLDALMKGDTDIGKLLNKSIESIEKGTIPEGASVIQKQDCDEKEGSVQSGERKVGQVRDRRDSSFSIGSDGGTVSDAERRKVSMKYMGTLPEGMNYETFVKQMSQENKNKSVMFTVFTSPEVTLQARRTPDQEPKVGRLEKPSETTGIECGYKSDTASTKTLTDINDAESQSARSTYSLGEQIKRLCEGQRQAEDQKLDAQTPRTGTETMDDVTPRLSNESPKSESITGVLYKGKELSLHEKSPVRNCSVVIEDCGLIASKDTTLSSNIKQESPKSVENLKTAMGGPDSCSPVRKRLKSKKERDQLSRRKQKESFILQSDSEAENVSLTSERPRQPLKMVTRSEEEMVITGSEDITPRPKLLDRQRSLLDEVQLETPSDSCEDKTLRAAAARREHTVLYNGPELSVACLQEFCGDLYVCYNGSEIRRFDLKSGRVLKELDCSPYLVNLLHVTTVEERQDILYTGGPCKKLMIFEPRKFNLIGSFNYTSKLTCFHENWGRLFIGLADGFVSVRSLKTDKELLTFSCTSSTVYCVDSSNAGMTKMLCLATADKVLYVVDALSGLLITMLEGHTQAPLYMQISDEKVVTGGLDKTLMIHNISTGCLLRMTETHLPVTYIYLKDKCVYTVSGDRDIRTYDMDLKSGNVMNTKQTATCCIVADGRLVVGYRNGVTDTLTMDSELYTCKFGHCHEQFGTIENLKLHIITNHVTSSKNQCDYQGCNYTFRSEDRRQNHMLRHVL